MQTERVVGLVAQNSTAYIARIFDLWDAGVVVVPLRSADDEHRIRLAGVTEVMAVEAGAGWLARPHRVRHDDTRAQILFTSGTEGEPKGVVLTHRNLANTVERLNAVMQVTDEIREYVGVPVYHSFGFARCRAVCAAGGQVFIPERGFHPLEINAMLERGQINAVSAVPSLWRVLLDSGAITPQAAAQMRWIEIGSQSMPAAEKRRLRTLFAQAVIVQHYGLTEASRSTFLEIHTANDAQLDSVGRPFGGTEVAVSGNGRIRIRGPHVCTQMLTGETATDPRDADGWLTTSDLGELRDGFLVYLGRADDVINCGGIKIAPEAMELGIVSALGRPTELAVCRVPDADRGDGILVAVAQQAEASDAAILRAALAVAASLGVSARDATHVLRVPQLARTENGKLKRQEIAKAYTVSPTTGAVAAQGQARGSLRDQIGGMLGVSTVGERDTFVDLGGDSLRYIQASVAIEKKLGYLPDHWERQPVATLDALKPRQTGWSRIEPSVLLRALAIISVVTNHSGAFKSLFAIDGAAFMLLLPAGYSFARFQLQRVLERGKALLALAALPRVIVPAMLILGVQQLRHRSFEPSALFLYNNYLNLPVLSLWFIEVYIQIHLILAALLFVPAIRRRLHQQPWLISAVALAISTLATRLMPYVWDTEPIWHRVPHMVMWYFFLGWCIYFAQAPWQRWVNTAFILGIGIMQGALMMPPDSRGLWIIAGGLFLSWAPTIALPSGLVRGISALASASLYIYASHEITLEPVSRLIPQAGYPGQIIGAILAGMVFWYGFETAWQWAAKLLRRKLS